MRTLVRLKALQAFEAVARHGSFVGAASELHVSSAAVGQLVRSFEAWLGSPLFHRRTGNERLVPTDDARRALMDVTEGLDRLASGLRHLTAQRTRRVVRVTASNLLMTKWLLPRLDDFASRYAEIDVRLDVADRTVDLVNGEADIGLRCGTGSWAGLQATRLVGEEIIAVCSPLLALAWTEAEFREWLDAQTLIHDTTSYTADMTPTWQDWLGRADASVPDCDAGLRINSSAAVIQAATKGHGLALVRHTLVAQDLADGRLVRLFPRMSWPIKLAYFAVAAPKAIRRPEVAAFHDWLVERWSAERPHTDAQSG